MALGRLTSGLLFESAFLQADADWILTPSAGAHSWIDGGGLLLGSGSMALHPLPATGDFSLLINIEPVPGAGTCGLTLYREDNYQVRLVAYDTAPDALPDALMLRRTDGVYLFMAGTGSSWQVVGSIRDEQMLYYGIFADGGGTITVTHALCTAEEDLVVQGLSNGHEVILQVGGVTVAQGIADAGLAVLDLGYQSRIDGNLRVLLNGTEVANLAGIFLAGDVYTLDLQLSVAINNQPISFGSEYTVPELDPDETLLQIDLFNLSNVDSIEGRTMRVAAFRPYLGVEWASLAADNGTGPDGTWLTTVPVPAMLPQQGCRLWARIKRDPSIVPYGPMHWARFNVIVI